MRWAQAVLQGEPAGAGERTDCGVLRGSRGPESALTAGFSAGAAEWAVVPFPEREGAGAGSRGKAQTRALFQNQDIVLNPQPPLTTDCISAVPQLSR